MYKIKYAIVLTSVFMSAAPALAAGAPASREITLDSVMKSGGRQFDRLDKNHDGVIDQSEWAAYVDELLARTKSRMAKRWSEMGPDTSGKVSREHFMASRAKWFAEVDSDHAGVIDGDKIRQYNYQHSDRP